MKEKTNNALKFKKKKKKDCYSKYTPQEAYLDCPHTFIILTRITLRRADRSVLKLSSRLLEHACIAFTD